jgi:hypothetical protein
VNLGKPTFISSKDFSLKKEEASFMGIPFK